MNKAILLSFAIFASLTARQEQETFLKAGQAYQEGNTEEAYTLYKSLPVKSAGTYYNMGNCAYRLKKPGYALAYWLQALKYAPRFMYPWLLQNIKQVQTELGVAELAWWHTAVAYVHTYIRLLFVQLFVIFLLSIMVVAWFTKRYTWWSFGLLGVLLALLVSLTVMTYRAWYQPSLVVVEKGCTLHTGPDEQFPSIKEIAIGTRAKVVGVQDSWYKISYLKERGWIQKSCVMMIT